MRTTFLSFALAFTSCLGVSTSWATPSYELLQPMDLGVPSKWDYAAIDSVHRRLFVTRGESVDVIDLTNGRRVGVISNTPGVHGVAFAPELALGFTSNGKANTVSVFDLDTLKPKGEIALVGKNPDAIVFEPLGKKLYVFNGGTNSVDIVDVATMKVAVTLQASGRPEFAVADGRGRIFFNIEDHAGINVIDTAAAKIVAKWPLTGCDEPSGLDIDVAQGRVFSACQNGIVTVTDAASGQRVTEFKIGAHPDALIFDPGTQTVFTSSGGGDGTLDMAEELDADHFAVRPSLVTAAGARTMAMDATSGSIYLPVVFAGRFVIMVARRK